MYWWEHEPGENVTKAESPTGGLSMSADTGKALFGSVLRKNKHLAIELPVAFLCLVSRAASPLTWVTKEPTKGATQAYVFLWLLGLAGLVGLVVLFPIVGLVFVAVGFYRLQDLFFSTLDDALSITGRFESARDVETKVLITLANIFQIVLIFTIAFSVLTTKADWHKPPSPFGIGSCFILSWSSLTPFTVNTSVMRQNDKRVTVIPPAAVVHAAPAAPHHRLSADYAPIRLRLLTPRADERTSLA
jgi:hypothetical protein